MFSTLIPTVHASPVPSPSDTHCGLKPFFLCLGTPHLLATVVEVTAEAGVAPDARCAETTAEVGAVHLRVHNSEEVSWHRMGGRNLWDWDVS